MRVVRERVEMGPKRGWDRGSLRDETIWERSWWSQELFGLGLVCGPAKNLVFATKELVDRLFLGADKLEHNRDTDELFSGEREPFWGPRNASVETDMMGHQGGRRQRLVPAPRFPFPFLFQKPIPIPPPLLYCTVHAVVFVHLPPLHLVVAFPLIPEGLDASSESVVWLIPSFFTLF
jgi:hypothetical protein